MKTKFNHYPTYAKAIIGIYIVNLVVIAGYRLVGMFEDGIIAEDTFSFLDIFSLFMNIATPVAIFLLLQDTKRGLWIVLGAIMALFIYDALIISSILGARYASAFYYYEIIFCVFLFFTFPIVRYLAKSGNKVKEAA